MHVLHWSTREVIMFISGWAVDSRLKFVSGWIVYPFIITNHEVMSNTTHEVVSHFGLPSWMTEPQPGHQ